MKNPRVLTGRDVKAEPFDALLGGGSWQQTARGGMTPFAEAGIC
jgi:hypothetical protein